MRTVPVQVVCRKCDEPFRTTVRGGNTRCPRCKTSRYVQLRQEWEGPRETMTAAAARVEEVNARAPVWCSCPGCEHEWQSRARDHVSVRCPSCGRGVRVPRRRWENTQPEPGAVQPLPAPAVIRQPPVEDQPYVPAPLAQPAPVPSAAPSLGRLLTAVLQHRFAPAAAVDVDPEPETDPQPRPAPTRRRPTSAPAPIPARTPGPPLRQLGDTAREERRQDSVCSLVRSMGSTLMIRWRTPAGRCEAMESDQPRERQNCPATVTHAVAFSNTVHDETAAYTCPEHARALVELAEGFPFISATAYKLR